MLSLYVISGASIDGYELINNQIIINIVKGIPIIMCGILEPVIGYGSLHPTILNYNLNPIELNASLHPAIFSASDVNIINNNSL